MIYTGIGSRKTPPEVLVVMSGIAQTLAWDGHILRSGGAPGADVAFERGTDLVPGMKQIFLPWIGFNDEERAKLNQEGVIAAPTPEALFVAQKYHPAFNRLSHGAKRLMARNSHQVLGPDLETPTDMLVCWTPGGKGSGGTGQALRIARDHCIPVIDIGAYDELVNALYAIEELVDVITR